MKLLRFGERGNEKPGLLDAGGFLLARTPQDNDELQALLGRALPPLGAQGTYQGVAPRSKVAPS